MTYFVHSGHQFFGCFEKKKNDHEGSVHLTFINDTSFIKLKSVSFLLLMFTSCPLLIAGTLFPAGLENRSEQESFKAGIRYGLETPQTPQTAKDSALNWEPCFLLFQSCGCWLPAHCHSSVCSTDFGTKISLIASQLLGNTPVTPLRIPLWLAGLALPQLSALESGWHFMTGLHENSKDQLTWTDRSRCALGSCKSLAKPATLVLAIWT